MSRIGAAVTEARQKNSSMPILLCLYIFCWPTKVSINRQGNRAALLLGCPHLYFISLQWPQPNPEIRELPCLGVSSPGLHMEVPRMHSTGWVSINPALQCYSGKCKANFWIWAEREIDLFCTSQWKQLSLSSRSSLHTAKLNAFIGFWSSFTRKPFSTW